MKFLCFILCCVLFTSYSTSVSADINNVFEGISNAVVKVKSDIKNKFIIKQEDRIVFPDSKDERKFPTAAPEARVVAKTTPPPAMPPVNPPAKSNSTTGKDGRENFAGACSSGFQRTDDGRCMPEY